MMDPITKDELLSDVLHYIELKVVVRLEELVERHRLYRNASDDIPPVQTLLAELVMKHKITEENFRAPDGPVRFIYFTAGTHRAHLLQKEMAQRVQYRPKDFDKLTPDQQWEWDKALGILDYRGEE